VLLGSIAIRHPRRRRKIALLGAVFQPVNDPEANNVLDREQRDSWQLPTV
jgi:hypothetical protein